ncbi:MAG: hypothetical protein WBW51_03060 [Methyloceanibacter sp.]
MRNAFATAGAALVFGGLAFSGPAQAVSPLPPYDATPLVIPAGDVENEEVWHDLRPDVTPPPAAVEKRGEEPEGSAKEEPRGAEGSGDVENQEIWHDLETGVTPPPGE